MKKLLSLLLVSVLICCFYTGCGRTTVPNCPRCNEAISTSDSFCRNCGYSLNETTLSATQGTSPINASHSTNNHSSLDTESQSTNPVHTHLFIAANCSTPATCSCGETYGEPLEHNWQNATCDKPSKCTFCNETKGEPIGHKWIAATYYSPKTCSICGTTVGEPITRTEKTAVGTYRHEGIEDGTTYSSMIYLYENNEYIYIDSRNDGTRIVGTWEQSGQQIKITYWIEGGEIFITIHLL